jgi:hypothetical protein
MPEARTAFITNNSYLADTLNEHLDEDAIAILYGTGLVACHLKEYFLLDAPRSATDVEWIAAVPAMRVSAYKASQK